MVIRWEGIMSWQYLAVIKQDYAPLTSEDQEVVPSNVGALKFGLMALLKEDSQDFERSNQLWQLGKNLLALEEDDDTGVGAIGKIDISDDLQLGTLGQGL